MFVFFKHWILNNMKCWALFVFLILTIYCLIDFGGFCFAHTWFKYVLMDFFFFSFNNSFRMSEFVCVVNVISKKTLLRNSSIVCVTTIYLVSHSLLNRNNKTDSCSVVSRSFSHNSFIRPNQIFGMDKTHSALHSACAENWLPSTIAYQFCVCVYIVVYAHIHLLPNSDRWDL